MRVIIMVLFVSVTMDILRSQSLRFKAAVSLKVSNSIETLLIHTWVLDKSVTLNPVNVHNYLLGVLANLQ